MSPILLLWLAFADHGYGPVDPVPMPDIHVTRHDGQRIPLAEALGPGRAAVQFIFTNCRATCPLLGQLFSRVDRLAAPASGRLVSITVDPAHDTPEKLAAWRQQFHASERWLALRPDPATLPALLKAFGQTDPVPAAHSRQIFLVENGRYAARTTELPYAANVAAALDRQVLMAGRETRHEALSNTQPCQHCHGDRLEGAAEGKTIAPALKSLSHPAARRGGPPAAYDEASFCRAVNTGIDPAGVVLGAVMPRYSLTAAECSRLWELVR